jgi:23S rRNA (guanosine2251-2'-O)-methyltransferase
VWGVHPVREMLTAAPDSVAALHIEAGSSRPPLMELGEAARRAGRPVEACDRDRLTALSRTTNHQGVVARMRPFAYADLEEIADADVRLILALDCVQDPRNLGAILRTGEAVGVGGVLLPKDRSVGVTAAVVRGAAGHVYRAPIAQVTNLVRAIEALKRQGWWAVGLSPSGEQGLYSLDLPPRVVLVIGGEGKGIRPLVLRACDHVVALPMANGVNSLNAAVAAGVALYEVDRRRRAAAEAPG